MQSARSQLGSTVTFDFINSCNRFYWLHPVATRRQSDITPSPIFKADLLKWPNRPITHSRHGFLCVVEGGGYYCYVLSSCIIQQSSLIKTQTPSNGETSSSSPLTLGQFISTTISVGTTIRNIFPFFRPFRPPSSQSNSYCATDAAEENPFRLPFHTHSVLY